VTLARPVARLAESRSIRDMGIAPYYHADSGASFLGINRLSWDRAGWPVVF
jgi:hypothetical protein